MSFKRKEANHICAVCGKKYYSCDYCSRIASWRSLCDTIECYKKLLESRIPAKEIRTDKTKEEMIELMAKPIEQVAKETAEDLSEYKEIIEESGTIGAVDEINKEIKSKRKSKR